MTRPRVVVLTGTPGVGKTTVAKALASRLGARYVGLGDVAKAENLVLETDEVRGTLVVDVRRLSRRVRELLGGSEGYVVVEGHYAPDVVSKRFMPDVFVLRRDPRELMAEYARRGYGDAKVSENLASEMLDVCLVSAVGKYGLEKMHEVDVTGRPAGEVVDEILGVLEGKRERRTAAVDWFSRLDEEGRLDEVLASLEKF